MFAERFSFVAELGAGSFGCVRKMMDNLATPPRLVAVKTLAQPAETWEHAVKLREVQLLMRLSHPGHPNIVRLEQVLREGAVVHLVFEYLSQSLYSRLRQGLAASQVRNICYQILQGLAHMHGCGVAHRDIKPENVLFDLNHTVKICDLGLARLTNDEPPFTSYHATRWYRAPELLLGATRYNCAVDMWAFGCIMPELYTGRPLFPGTSELNQLVTICTVKGTISEANWPGGMELARKMRIHLPHHEPQTWQDICPDVRVEAVQLMEAALAYDPARRVTAKQALSFPLFDIAFIS